MVLHPSGECPDHGERLGVDFTGVFVGTGDEEALQHIHAKIEQAAELSHGLHTLGQDQHTTVVCESDQAGDQMLAILVLFHFTDQRHVQLHILGHELQQILFIVVAGAEVIQGKLLCEEATLRGTQTGDLCGVILGLQYLHDSLVAEFAKALNEQLLLCGTQRVTDLRIDEDLCLG